MPELLLLGGVRFRTADGQVDLAPEMPTWLLAFLASQDGWIERSTVASLFWPEVAEATARHNLSQLLYRSRKQPWSPLLETEAQRIRYSGGSDVRLLQGAVASADWSTAADLYRGPLLGNHAGPDLSEWDEWLQAERENLHALWSEAARTLAGLHAGAGRTEDALALLRQMIQHDPLDEDAVQLCLELAAGSSQRGAVLSLYESFRERLSSELGMEPVERTTALARQLRQPGTGSGGEPGRSHGLSGAPATLGGFIGRDLEVAQLVGELQRPDVRLVTVTGPGGMGKTRLVIEAGNALAGSFDQAVFVPLAPVQGTDRFLPTVAAALGLDLAGNLPAPAVIAAFLANRPTLLVLDNFEHLTDASGQLGKLLEQAPLLKVLVSTRARLGLTGELLFELTGLSVPAAADDPSFTDHGAVRMFLGVARRLGLEPELTESGREGIQRTVSLLEGLPLGIELAVPWLNLFTPAELADELEGNLDLLAASDGSDLPDRHRSLQAAFEHSWQLLGDTERSALARLAVFKGSFSRDAALAVAQAPLPVLLSLMSRSLVRRAAGGRFELHPPARQYALDRGGSEHATRQAHAEYLAELAAGAETGLEGSGQREWLERLSLERTELLAAIDWALLSDEATTGLRIATAMQALWWLRGPYREGADVLLALCRLPSAADSPLLGRGLHRAGTLLQELGEDDALQELYERALALAVSSGDAVLQADVLHSQGYRLDRQGELDAAAGRFAQAVTLYREQGHLPGESASLNSLAVIQARLGEFDGARQLLLESLRQKRELGQTQGVAYALNNLGVLHQNLGEPEAGKRFIRESTELKKQIGDTRGVISAGINEAADLLEDGDLSGAGSALAAVGDEAWRLGNIHLLLLLFTIAADLAEKSGDPGTAALLAGGTREFRERFRIGGADQALEERLRTQLGVKQASLHMEEGSTRTLEQLVELTRRTADSLQSA